MAHSFDIVDAIGNGYAATWRERRWLVRLALVPVTVKIVSLQAILLLGLERNFLGQAIVLLPSFVLEGWLLVRYVRLLVLGERWPEHQNAPGFRPDPRPVLAGLLIYVLAQFVLRGLVAFMASGVPPEGVDVPQIEPDALAFAMAGGILIGVLWAFRYVWLYIPAALGMGLMDFLSAIRGFSVSFAMIGVWIASFLPFLMILGALAGIVFSPSKADSSSLIVEGAMSVIQAAFDTIILLVSTAAMTYGIRQMLSAPKP